ncbi:uncharacterized protein DEA37_0008369 [Paragonimus westermani]|uniref:Uncharacterized protein n=1 Tax=Paragonimus westermani TaxID=34504 RepID=A0A5J4NHQ5_9TREM|nr:uncharacterized protein DEA37_0008369 [Paragonimus westermani]
MNQAVCVQPHALRRLEFKDGCAVKANINTIKNAFGRHSLLCLPEEQCYRGFKTVNTNQHRSETSSHTSMEQSTLEDESSSTLSGKNENDKSSSSSTEDSLRLRCCLLSACCECCVCLDMPKSYDRLYYDIQRRTAHCPNGCPTIVPRPDEEEWNLPGGYGGVYACSSCCKHPGWLICLKYIDCVCCPLCPMWDICRGLDEGYRRFRVQLIIERYRDSHKRRYITCV